MRLSIHRFFFLQGIGVKKGDGEPGAGLAYVQGHRGAASGHSLANRQSPLLRAKEPEGAVLTTKKKRPGRLQAAAAIDPARHYILPHCAKCNL